MIPQTNELPPGQKTPTQKTAGGNLQHPENILLSRRQPIVASLAERQQAATLMRYQLYLLDPSERRMSIEDYAAALLEKSDLMS